MDRPKRKGRWRPGESGNLRGRPPGTGEAAELRALIRKPVPAIIDSMVARAIAGDVGAAKLLLDKVLPSLRSDEQATPLPLRVDGTLTDAALDVMRAAVAGAIGPFGASALLSAIGSVGRVTEVDEQARRIAALEQRDGKFA